MTGYKVSSPVALIAFNRPDLVRQVLSVVRTVRPHKLFLIVDGPRDEHPEDAEKCAQVRQELENIDWECQVQREFADENMGVFRRPHTGISWVFQHVEQAIVLEDDIVPDVSFFQFCDELLHRFQNDNRVMMISGFNYLGTWKDTQQSYHFSALGGIWGWASWRRAWDHYDPFMEKWRDPEIRKAVRESFRRPVLGWYRFLGYDSVYRSLKQGEGITWDYQWGLSRLLQSGLTVIPSCSLTRNIGFGDGATHRGQGAPYLEGLSAHEMGFPLRHPDCVMSDRAFDEHYLTRLMRAGGRFPKSVAYGVTMLRYLSRISSRY